MTRKADTLRPFLRCAAVVLCSLALPLAVFALWDRALLAAPHIRTDGERFSAAVRDFGAAGYSKTAQVYAVANASGYSVTLSAASMTPQTFAALNTQYGEETS